MDNPVIVEMQISTGFILHLLAVFSSAGVDGQFHLDYCCFNSESCT